MHKMIRTLEKIYQGVFPSKRFEDCSDEEQREIIGNYRGRFIPGACYNLFAEEASYSRHFEDHAQNLLVSPRCHKQVPLLNCIYVRDEPRMYSRPMINDENKLHVFAFIHRGELYRVKYCSSLDRRLGRSKMLSPSSLNSVPKVDIVWVHSDSETGHTDRVWSFLGEASLLVSEENRERRKTLPKNSEERFLPCGTLMGYDLSEGVKLIIRRYTEGA